jgi:hypothetical protein
MKEHKNPKVLSDGILWMVSAVEDFGISNLKLKVRFPMLVCSILTVSSLDCAMQAVPTGWRHLCPYQPHKDSHLLIGSD